MKTFLLFTGLILIGINSSFAQATFNTGTGIYSQDFGSATTAGCCSSTAPTGGNVIAAGNWVNNSAIAGSGYLGWYISTDQTNTASGQSPPYFNGTWDINAGTNKGNTGINSGGVYMYTLNGGLGLMLGMRPADSKVKSGGACPAPCSSYPQSANNSFYIGLELKNNLGTTINSIKIQFDWYQVTQAENNANYNKDFVDYQVGTTENNILSAGTWTEIPNLDFTAQEDGGGGTTTTLATYPTPVNCTSAPYPPSPSPSPCQTQTITECIDLNASGKSIAPGKEIMIRWTDPNNVDNDPHLAIDNIIVTAYLDDAAANGTTCSNVIVLPIKLLSFTAEYNETSSGVDLKWATATEINNKLFTIEKTQDGINWLKVFDMPGSGNSSQTLYYLANDEKPYPGLSYYRLKQTDYDGNYSYSDIVSVNADMQLNTMSVAPNPTNNYTAISFPSRTEGNALLSIYDWTGKLISTKPINMTKGTTSTMLDISGFRNGMYFIRVDNNAEQFSTKLIVVHQ